MRLTSLNDITTKYRHIFLSPHFDDVVYSCGGTLGVQVSCGLRPLVITVFAGPPAPGQRLSPLAIEEHGKMGVGATQPPEYAIEVRRKEDAAALDYLQSDYLWLDYPEATYRGTPPHYTTVEQIIGGEVHPADLSIDQHLAQDLLDLQKRLPDTSWYVPLGIGRHVDHQIVASAADRLVQRGAKVYFYEDFPYVTKQGALEARLQELGGTYEPELVEVSEMVPQRVKGSLLYPSQIARNFPNQEAIRKTVESYTYNIRPVETVRLERYWTAR